MENIIDINNLNTFYGESQILRDINLQVRKGSITTIMGRNGVGKSTLLKALTGILKAAKGKILFKNEDITDKSPDKRAKAGIGYVPQGREIFPKLTVFENLKIGLQARRDNIKKVPEEEIYSLFPVLGQMKKRMGGNLSGGQQQQLAIARALVGQPEVLLLDEPTEGIQPNIIDDIEEVLRKLKNSGQYTIILVEQSLDFAEEVSDHYFVLERGTVVLEGSSSELTADRLKKHLAF